ncbi:MAG: S8 family serine peptidase [Verrucomicrobiaceae bacterium]|nr:S8 family serine peptidase [Verrucomicrobiaceae bacterium]
MLRLYMKVADTLRARALADGRLAIEPGTAVNADDLMQTARDHDLRFKRVHSVSDADLNSLERRAAVRTGMAQPDAAGLVEVVPKGAASRAQMIGLARVLHALAAVEFAELESLDAPSPPPASDIAPPTPLLSGGQSYRSAGSGIDVDYVWNALGVRGHPSVRLTDCEYSFNATHEDLAGLTQIQPGVVSMYTAFGDDHGAAVQGMLGAGVNGYGMTGCAPACAAWFFPEFSTLASGSQNRAACVTAAIAASAPGDVVLLEMQATGAQGGYGPAEYSPSVFNAVKLGADAGVIIIGAAGNGAENLDDAAYAAYRSRGDSGAIIVGAGTAARAPLSFSTHGLRVNLQGWGEGVSTTGYGTLAIYGGDANQKYASDFGGTSSAAALVSAAAVLLQSVAVEICETRLSPAEMRALLVSSGRAQTGDVTRNIGPLPDLRAAVAALVGAHPPPFSTLRSWALFHFGTPSPPPDADPDGDGAPNLVEYVLGTDPRSDAGGEMAASAPRLTAASSDGTPLLVFEFHHPPSRAGAAWSVQQSPDLTPGSWLDVVPGTGGATMNQEGGVCRVTLPRSPGAARGFVRLHVTAP